MTDCILKSTFGFYDYGFESETKASSKLAEKLSNYTNSELNDYRSRTVSNENPKDSLINKLISISKERSHENWDGYDASPINYHALENAISFSMKLPKDIAIPEVTAEPDGEIALEWYGKGGSVFSISFGETKVISFAGLFSDGKKVYGTDNVDSYDKELFKRFISKIHSDPESIVK